MDIRALILAGVAGLVPTAGHGESALLREALSAMPDTALDFSQPDMFVFVDVRAVLAIGGDPVTAMAMTRAGLAARLRPVDVLRTVGPERFIAGPGITLDDIAGFSGYGQPPSMVSFWHFLAPETAETLYAGLGTLGYTESQPGVIGNGEPGRVDFTRRDPFDAWIGQLGKSSFAAVYGDLIVHADQPGDAAAALWSTRSALDNPAVATALAGLEQATGDGIVVQAMLFSPIAGLVRPDFSLDAGFEDMVDSLGETVEGVPPYAAGIVADVQIITPGLAVSLTYPDCDTAKEAAKRMEAFWPTESERPRFSSWTVAGTFEAEVGCAAQFLALQTPETGRVDNHAMTLFFRAFLQQEPSLITIGG